MTKSMRKYISFYFGILSVAIFQLLWSQSGAMTGHTREGETYILNIDSARVRLSFYSSDIARIDMLPSSVSRSDSSFVIIQSPSSVVTVTVFESDSDLVFRTDRMRIACVKRPFRMLFYTTEGKLLLEQSVEKNYLATGESRSLQFVMQKSDHFYGTGERGTKLDKRGERFVSYNTQIGGYSEPLGTMNLNVPFTANPNGYALYIDNTYRGIFDFGKSDPSVFSYTAEGGELSWYFIAAPSIPEQLQRFTWLSGRQPLPPRWAMGFIQSKNRYQNEQEARSIVATMRAKDFPCDAIVLDLAWFKSMGDISWDKTAWPSHETMVTDFLSEGMKTILITEPYIIQPSKNFKEADSLGYLAKGPDGKTSFMDKWWSCGDCRSTLLDLTDPNVQQWWWSKHTESFGKHVAGIWTDLGEPEKHPESMKHFLGSAVKVHNIYNLLWAKTIYEGFTSIRPNERVLNITRSGFAGIQRYGVLPWSGDVSRSFGGLSVQLPMLLNMGMSGIAYHSSDLGGYARNATTPELYVRWMQFGVFTPIARAHGAGESVKGYPTEPWMFGKEAERINRKYLELRYQLLPYNYSLAFQNYTTGIPLARPLFWSEPENEALMNESSSYLWGDAFLVSPVVSAGQIKKDVTLPKGKWFDYWTDDVIDGGRTVTVAAPLEKLPLYVKAGSIIPMAPVMKYSDERPLDTLTVHVYPEHRTGAHTSFVLYEDDGKTREYMSGNYATTEFTLNETKDSTFISVRPSDATFAGFIKRRVFFFDIRWTGVAPSKVRIDGKELRHEKNRSALNKNDRTYHYDARSKRLTITVSAPGKESLVVTVLSGRK